MVRSQDYCLLFCQVLGCCSSLLPPPRWYPTAHWGLAEGLARAVSVSDKLPLAEREAVAVVEGLSEAVQEGETVRAVVGLPVREGDHDWVGPGILK